MSQAKVPLPGSQCVPVSAPAGAPPPDERIDVSVLLKPKNRIPAKPGEHISRDAFAETYGADPAAIRQLEEFARENGLKVIEVSAARRTVKLEGTAAQMQEAFGTTLQQCELQGRTYRARTAQIHLPAQLAAQVEAVLGLDNRPQAQTHFRVRAAAAGVSYSPRQVAQLYNFPLDVDGTGQTVGIIELGGGYKPADLKNYFTSLKLKQPSVTAVSVDGGTNSPTTPDSADGEVLLDVEVVGAVAPGAKIVVYFAPNTDQGFLDALTSAIHDTTHKPSVISISWGGPESTWTPQAMTAFDSAAQDAMALGVTVCAACGDDGSDDGVGDGMTHVDFPASSPHILACGGTSLQSSNGAITSETVWNDGSQGGATGGGFSVQFPQPAWQASAKIKPPANGGRGLPDVSGDADPQTGYDVLVDGESLVIGGTSAVAPLWAGLIALLNEKLGKPVGFIQPQLYALPSSDDAFRDITSGSNGAYSAGPGWDPVSGLGSPSGENLLEALSGSTATAT